MTLQISGLTVRYGEVTALDRLDLTVAKGELFVLLGGSGSGKTTLLQSVAGFVRPHSGQIMLDGVDLVRMPPHRRPVNTMFQSYALFPHMSVAANIAFGLRHRGLSRAAIAARVADMLALVRLAGFDARRPHELSGGQQQRVALARSLAPNPSLLLLDEPLSALDRGLRSDTRAELVRLQRQLGTSFVLVTHDQEEALTMADRIGVMSHGRLAQVGTPSEVYERPVSRFVAEFLGAANILPGVIQAGGVFVSPQLGLSVMTAVRDERQTLASLSQAAVGHSPAPGACALLALRPERLRLNDATLPNSVSGSVVDRAYAGETLVHTIRLDDGTLMRISNALRDGFVSARLEIGTAATIGWAPEACILLPAE
jgi:spermidine/putrescine ABC transporter ATP-binding subunit